MTRPHPLSIYQGDDYTAIVNVTRDGTPIPLTGFSAPAAQLRRDVADNDATVDATFTCTIVGSTVTMALTRTITAALSGCYVYDLQLTDPTGHLITIVPRSSAQIVQEVTRP